MGDFILDAEAHPLEWWPMSKVVSHFGIGKKKLKELAASGEVEGYPNPHFRRGGGKNSEGEWFFSVKSLHEYHLRMGGFGHGRGAVERIAARQGW